MPIVTVILVLLFVGFVLYMLTSAPIPIHPWIRTLIIGLVCFALILWILSIMGVSTGMHMRLT